MLGAAGVVGTSALHAAGTGVPEWYDAGKVSAENTGIPLSSLLVVQMILMHFVEIKRLEDFKKPGSQSESGSFFGFESSFKGTGDPSYPGGAFDPLGLASGPPAVVDAMKTREIKNGRLAMVACLGFAGQHGAQPDGPIANLARHLANPPQNCFATNGVSLPALF
jgi:light-harvesting complex I chlorophyll a/b binding protein 5